MAEKYAFGRTVALSQEEAIVLTEIDVAATLKKKLGVEVPPYRILGACNPEFARRALEAEPQIGTLLPCNVVVREEAGKTRVEAMDPLAVMRLVGREDVEAIAREVRERLQRALAAV